MLAMTFQAPLNKATPGCPPALLTFDEQNPRLEDGRNHTTRTDVDAIRALKEVGALGELISSICANGYIDIEPLVVMGDDGGPYRVLEGNRRLAAIKLISDPALAEKCKVTVPQPVRPAVLDSLKGISVYRVQSLDDARAFIGFKHINGPQRWESFAKAKYVAKWYMEGRQHGVTIDSIARELGDDNSTIRNMIAGMLVLEQAENAGFDSKDKFNKGRFAFSHLYTALTRNEYQDHLGLKKGWNSEPSINPVPKEKSSELAEVMRWLYGSKSRAIEPLVKSQNPDLADLGDALKNKISLSLIRSGATLADAVTELKPVNTLLGDAMVAANAKLRESVVLAGRAEVNDPSLMEIGKQIAAQARSLVTLLNSVGTTDTESKE